MDIEYTLGIISDPHSNLQALESVLEHMAMNYPITKIICVGDIVGYYTQPSEVLERCLEVCDIMVMGNHDDAAARGFINPEFNVFAAAALDWSIKNLSIDQRKILYNLSAMETFEMEKTVIQMVHGSPEYPLDYYVFNGKNGPNQDQIELADYMELCALDVMFFGHTHRPYIREINGKILANPGSAGQPRDGNPRPSYMVFDPKNKKGIIERVTYDIELTMKLIEEAELPSQLGKRLMKGK